MLPRKIEGANVVFGAPEGWDEATQGPCIKLHARVVRDDTGMRVETAWEPSPEELAMLNAGGSVILSVVGGQPPVWISAAAPAEVVD